MTAAQAMATDITNALSSGQLSAAEISQLQGVLTEIVGSADLAEAYVEASSVSNIDNKNGFIDNKKEALNLSSHTLETARNNIEGFIAGDKDFNDVVDDYAKLYGSIVNSNQSWQWDEDVLGGEDLSRKQRERIKARAVENGYIPDIKTTNVNGKPIADFRSAGVVKKSIPLPKEMWLLSDKDQFNWLDEQIGGNSEGYTWHHSEIPGQMELVPFGIHNITYHYGGRSQGMWANASR